jgi:ABC-type multidrug transport system ATPase subunit
LGHNGAGKTTTIQMLTGLLTPTSGNAHVYGIDAFADQDTLQELMGVCPQHDVLFENLTVEEHLILFANFKNTPSDKIQIQIN